MDMPLPLSTEDADALIGDMGRRARAAVAVLAVAPTAQKAEALTRAAALLRERKAAILAANAEDLARADAAGISAAMRDRLVLDEKRLAGVASALEDVAGLDDPVGAVIDVRARPNGLSLSRVRPCG